VRGSGVRGLEGVLGRIRGRGEREKERVSEGERG
jgi:hypothetical protein